MISDAMYCRTCKFMYECENGPYKNVDPYYCLEHNHELYEQDDFIKEWLNSFDTASATECFTAVNLLKEAIEDDKR